MPAPEVQQWLVLFGGIDVYQVGTVSTYSPGQVKVSNETNSMLGVVVKNELLKYSLVSHDGLDSGASADGARRWDLCM